MVSQRERLSITSWGQSRVHGLKRGGLRRRIGDRERLDPTLGQTRYWWWAAGLVT
ncbi:MAG TPA: hypothetical protein VNM72_03240 [Blastocatellia bacterium]|nr:hypothetical protein [Blastocatellia bacterium]